MTRTWFPIVSARIGASPISADTNRRERGIDGERDVAIAIVAGVGAAIVAVDSPSGTMDRLARRRGRDPADRGRTSDRAGCGGRTTRPRALVALGIRPARCWDLGAVHRMLVGGWRTSPAAIWATCHGLDLSTSPQLAGAPDLFSDHDRHVDADDPLDAIRSPERRVVGRRLEGHAARRVIRWASLAAECFVAQRRSDRRAARPGDALATAHSESAAEQLCAPNWSTTGSPSTSPSPKR